MYQNISTRKISVKETICDIWQMRKIIFLKNKDKTKIVVPSESNNSDDLAALSSGFYTFEY